LYAYLKVSIVFAGPIKKKSIVRFLKINTLTDMTTADSVIHMTVICPFKVFRHFLEHLNSFFPELSVSHNMTLDNFQYGEAIRHATALAVMPSYGF